MMMDAFGREINIPRAEWVARVLPGLMERSWDNAEEMAALVGRCIEQGMAAEIREAAKRLNEIDTNRERAAALLCVMNLQLGHLSEAEGIMNGFIHQHGRTPFALLQMAKIHAGRQNRFMAMRTLWESIEKDPNQEHAFMWYLEEATKVDGEPIEESLARVASLPGSWLARLWQARAALGGKDTAKAIAFTTKPSRVRKARPDGAAPHDEWRLGQSGHSAELLQICEPLFVAKSRAGLGNNLIKANFDAGNIDKALAIVESLYALKVPLAEGSFPLDARDRARAPIRRWCPK
jgi:hypothetical protein